MMSQLHVYITTAFFWAAYWCAPRELRPILASQIYGIHGAMEQIALGRTFGVLFAGWSVGDEQQKRAAEYMEEAVREAATRARVVADTMGSSK